MLKIMGSVIVASAIHLFAASPSIGVVRSTGDFMVDGSYVQGNSTLFSGNTVETAAAQSTIRLDDLDLALSPKSRARVYKDHAILETGSAVVTGSPKYAMEANKLRINSQNGDSVWQIAVVGPGRINIAAQKGGAEVRNDNGVLLAIVRPGVPLAFAPQAGANAPPPPTPPASDPAPVGWIVGGIIGAGTIIGLAASGTFNGSSVSTP